MRELPVHRIFETLDQAVARFEIAIESIDESGDAINVGVVIVVSDNAVVVDIVEGTKKRDVEVGQTQDCRVLCGKADGTAENGVVRPYSVLQEE